MTSPFQFYRMLSPKDRALVFWVTLGALFLSSFPYLFGLIAAGRQHVFLGMNPLGSADTNVYLSFIRQVAHGHIFIENLHTSEIQHGSLFHPLWLLLGWISGLFRIAPVVVFHAARVLLGAVFLLFLYFFFSLVFPESRRRNIAFVLAAFSSGIGVFFSIGISEWDPIQAILLLPSDQWISESNTFLTLIHSPLFILSQLMLLVLFWLFLEEDTIKNFFLAGGVIFFLVLMHPYDLITVAILLPAFVLVRLICEKPNVHPDVLLRLIKRLALLALFALPPLVMFFVGNAIEPAIGGWTKQNVTTSPMIHSYLIGYGLLLAFAVAGFVALRKTRSRTQLFVLTWVIVSALLIYVPIQVNRRLTNGLHLPLVMLAAVGLDLLWQRFRTPKQPRLGRMLVQSSIGWIIGFGLFFTTIAVVVKAVYWEQKPADSFSYIPLPVAAGMDWLGAHAPSDAIILAHSYDGNIIPARTGLRVYIGHGHQTIDWDKKRSRVMDWFFKTNDDDANKASFLRTNRISYIFFGPTERKIGLYQPKDKPYLTPVFVDADVTVYAVRSR